MELLDFKCEKYKLANGLEVVLYKDNTLPLVAVNIWYKVGSANEISGKTGFAHLFEHMMFQGSENVKKEMHFKYIQEAGGSLNASTSMDRTNYYETLPSSSLELALWLESDRMGFLIPSLTEEKLQNQKEVVMNERRQRYDNQPYGKAWEIIFSNLFPKNHSYHWPTIGWMEDIEKFKLEDVVEFFNKYYAPNNASLVIAGDIEYDETKKLVEKYFGEINSSNSIAQPQNMDFQLKENKIIVHEDNIQLERIYFAWKSEKVYNKMDAPLDILSEVLSGSKNGRLHKNLIFDNQYSQDVFSFQYSAQIVGSFIISSTARPGITLDIIKKEILDEINTVIEGGISDDELLRAKNSIKSSYIYSLQNLATLSDSMNSYNCTLNEPNSFNFDISRYENVTKEDVRVAAEKILSGNYVQLNIIPKQG